MPAWELARVWVSSQTSERPALETVTAAYIAAFAVVPSAASMAAATHSLLVNSNSTKLIKQKNSVLGHSYLHSINPINYKDPATSLFHKKTLRVDKISIHS